MLTLLPSRLSFFNDTRNLLFYENETIKQQAKKELELYFNKIAQASFGDMCDFDMSTLSTPLSVYGETREHLVFKINDVLQSPRDQDLRNMRHHVHCQDLNGVIGYYPRVRQEINKDSMLNVHGHRERLNTNEMINKNTQVNLGGLSSINDFNKYQLDMLSYTYPYHMQIVNCMKPRDCQPIFRLPENKNTLEYKVSQFNLRHPLIQLRFNVHDSHHMPSCF